MTLEGAGASGPPPVPLRLVIPGRRSEADASPESMLPDLWLWIPGSRPAAEPRNDCTDGIDPTKGGTIIRDRWTALISLGIPKSVRFVKIHPPTVLYRS